MSKIGVGVFLRRPDKKILLIHRTEKCRNEKNKWQIPGGALDDGETIFETACREIEEEVGIILQKENIRPIGCFTEMLDEEWCTFFFISDIPDINPTLREPDKHDNFMFTDVHHLPQDTSILTKKAVSLFL